jgi:hypothetical protein
MEMESGTIDCLLIGMRLYDNIIPGIGREAEIKSHPAFRGGGIWDSGSYTDGQGAGKQLFVCRKLKSG